MCLTMENIYIDVKSVQQAIIQIIQIHIATLAKLHQDKDRHLTEQLVQRAL